MPISSHCHPYQACGAAVRGAYLEVDFGPCVAVWLDAYCLGYNGMCGSEWFTRWRLDASPDGESWLTLREHDEKEGFREGEVTAHEPIGIDAWLCTDDTLF